MWNSRRVRCLSRTGFLAVVLAVALLAGSAAAADRVSGLAKKLRASKDFRVRTQAALALGASSSQRAVAPLCTALADSNQSVRAAAAAALGKLAKGGERCVSERLRAERHPTVKRVLTKVLKRLRGAGPAVIGPSTRYYVALGDATNKTPLPGSELEQLVRGALERELAKGQALAVAPEGETADQARAVLKKHPQLKPIFLWPKVQASVKRGTVKFKLSFTMFSYPDKAFKGSMAQKLSIRGATSADIETLQELLDVAVPRLVARFLANVEKLQ